MDSSRNFTIIKSGKFQDRYYIDCSGSYRTNDIAQITGLHKEKVDEIYLSFGAKIDEETDVYFFPSRISAIGVLKKLDDHFSHKGLGKMVFLTFEEMDYIRKALINEGSNIINVRNDIKKVILDKFS